MASQNPFEAPGQWFRGNTHSHSTESDGKVSIAERFAGYRDHGYDFLVLTDHGKVSDVSSQSEAGFLAISGSELHPPNPYGGDRYHFVAINIHEPVDYGTLHPNEVIADVVRQGGEAVLCHPYWSGHTLLDHSPLTGYLAIEVYNDTCMAIGKGFAEEAWDNLLNATGRQVYGLSVDDAHAVADDCYHAWINVKATELSVEAVMAALRSGSYYSSMGPEFMDLSVEPLADGTHRVSVVCNPARGILFKCQRSRGRRILASGDDLVTEGEYIAPKDAEYVRVEVVDDRGNKAWSNPFFLGSKSDE